MDADPIKGLLDLQQQQLANMEGIQKIVDTFEAHIAAQQAALYALIATHPNPRGLFDEFATYMDLSAPEDGEEPDDQLREAMQRLQRKMLKAASRQTK